MWVRCPGLRRQGDDVVTKKDKAKALANIVFGSLFIAAVVAAILVAVGFALNAASAGSAGALIVVLLAVIAWGVWRKKS